MDQIQQLPRSIGSSVMPTMKAYEPLLRANATAIRSTKFETCAYGSHPRQTLDVYYPTKRRRPSVSSGNVPVLIFLHGGGLVVGSKTLPLADGLAHANVGHFFADKFGYTTIIPDYRLMSHGARFPSGGEDLAQVVAWVRETMTRQDGYQNVDLFIMGNSAGGIHLATYLFAPDFANARNKIMTQDPQASVVLRGVVFLSVPFNFRQADPSRAEVIKEYFRDIEANSPQGLLKATMLRDPDNVLLNVKVMVLNGSLDPEDEILDPKKEFLDEWDKLDEGSRQALTVAVMDGQNHISPPLSLGTDIEREEAWGHQVGDFLDSLRS
ncbi:hypothetical protein LTR70_008964 [Exophiala xenobiotica]|uniref:BD-FAE-like domain-containing protein n=1 Tax=Lithohypha guttulata TaxID=1690604 RepID=A0ABR0JZ45_9EURO|nr:hypothetical protein LTR24_008700 [Lithohypha guttulata]KAK5311162.1 hypothetical protein LTR70_008964 [Exophiala xenobiotica]